MPRIPTHTIRNAQTIASPIEEDEYIEDEIEEEPRTISRTPQRQMARRSSNGLGRSVGSGLSWLTKSSPSANHGKTLHHPLWMRFLLVVGGICLWVYGGTLTGMWLGDKFPKLHSATGGGLSGTGNFTLMIVAVIFLLLEVYFWKDLFNAPVWLILGGSVMLLADTLINIYGLEANMGVSSDPAGTAIVFLLAGALATLPYRFIAGGMR